MSDKELEEYFKTVNPNFSSHIEKGTIEMSNEYYNLLEERMARLINENQQLKESLKDEEQQKLDFIKWLESKNQFHYKNGKIEDNYILVSEVLNKVRGD